MFENRKLLHAVNSFDMYRSLVERPPATLELYPASQFLEEYCIYLTRNNVQCPISNFPFRRKHIILNRVKYRESSIVDILQATNYVPRKSFVLVALVLYTVHYTLYYFILVRRKIRDVASQSVQNMLTQSFVRLKHEFSGRPEEI